MTFSFFFLTLASLDDECEVPSLTPFTNCSPFAMYSYGI